MTVMEGLQNSDLGITASDKAMITLKMRLRPSLRWNQILKRFRVLFNLGNLFKFYIRYKY